MNEYHILKYLDNELSDKEKEAFEEQLHSNPALKRKHDEVKSKRQVTRKAIGLLNPPEPVVVPDFDKMNFSGKKRLWSFYRWCIAAVILIFAVATAGYFFLQHDGHEEHIAANHHTNLFVEEAPSCSEIDFYISPNRCWHRRQLIWTYVSNQP